jgi:membrane protease YdiL (CAAX protease family)
MKTPRRALLEVIVLFLPSIPAYIWLWPNVTGASLWAADIVVYLYVLAGTLFIGLRRWKPDALGLNRRGLAVSLGSGLLLVGGRVLVMLALNWGKAPPPYSALRLAGDILYYFGMVGLVEELLFRGLVYRIFEDWLGLKWAIWGSSLGFMLWHIFGHGPIIGLVTLFFGLFFALARWRAGGILGLVVVHGLMDITSAAMLPDSDVLGLGRPQIPYPGLVVVGYLLILLGPLYLWKIHPRVMRWVK